MVENWFLYLGSHPDGSSPYPYTIGRGLTLEESFHELPNGDCRRLGTPQRLLGAYESLGAAFAVLTQLLGPVAGGMRGTEPVYAPRDLAYPHALADANPQTEAVSESWAATETNETGCYLYIIKSAQKVRDETDAAVQRRKVAAERDGYRRYWNVGQE